jgi:amino acid transporter
LRLKAKPDAGTINTFGVRILKYLNNVSVLWHALGTTSLGIAILAAAPKHQSGKFVFRTFIDGTGVDGVGWSQRASPAYVAVIGILLAQYTLTGGMHVSPKDIHFLIDLQDLMQVRI